MEAFCGRDPEIGWGSGFQIVEDLERWSERLGVVHF